MNCKSLTVLGVVATVVGAASTLLGNWVAEKQMDEKIEEKVSEAIAKKENEEEESN